MSKWKDIRDPTLYKKPTDIVPFVYGVTVGGLIIGVICMLVYADVLSKAAQL